MLARTSLFAAVTLASLGLVACSSGSSSSTFGGGGTPRPEGCEDDVAPAATSEVVDGETLGDEENGMHGFATEADLRAYLADIAARRPRAAAPCGVGAGSADAGAQPSAAADDGSGASNENVTNNQEEGVDEGGIVKNIGDALVILRKGRLYAANVAGASPVLLDSIRVARTESLNANAWYDEMLVKGNVIYVVGYRYGGRGLPRGATEIDSFVLADGKLQRRASRFLESNDYYSGVNYASRMVDGKLVFYMPHYIATEDQALSFPRVMTVDDAGTFAPVGPIFGVQDVTTSLQKPVYPTFHTVVQCELDEQGGLDCHGRSVIGGWWRQTYVSPDAVYLWSARQVYRFDFASLAVTTHAASGYPIDQFSFKQTEDALLVTTNGQNRGAVTTMPLAAFDQTGKQALQTTDLPGAVLANRFVGDVLVAATGTYANGTYDMAVTTFDPTTRGVASAPLGKDRRVVRIEPAGERRAVIATADASYRSQDLTLETRSLDALGAPLGTITLEGVSQGESRSHGFFYKPGEGGAGRFGYAVIDQRAGYDQGYSGWGGGISNLGFFDVSAAGAIGTIGIVSSTSDVSVCETSCVDWYGNTRPIFLGSRVYALMGSELAEVALGSGAKTVGTPLALVPQP